MHGKAIGIVHGASHIEMNIKLSEPSELKFDVPAVINGEPNPDYDRITGHKQIYTKHYGIYSTLNPSVENDGDKAVKHVTAYSLEKTLGGKRFFMEEGTYRFWDPVDPQDTILGRVLEKAPGWHIGTVSTTLLTVFRTFDQIDEDLLSFIYNTLGEKYQCIAVFDPYNMSIDVYDKNEDQGVIPVYLDHDNLIEKLSVEEKSEELITALRPYGADELSIREVNPTGSPWIYDLTNFIENGDLPEDLVDKWEAWETKIASRREYYIALISLRASTSARLLAEKAKLTDMNGELDVIKARRDAKIQEIALAKTYSEKQTKQAELDAINAEITAKNTQIAAQQTVCNNLSNDLDDSKSGSIAYKIKQVVNDLAFDNVNNFTAEEQLALQQYFIESDMTEDTFVATDIDTKISGASNAITTSTTYRITGADITKPPYPGEGSTKSIYMISGGSINVTGTNALSGQIMGGTLESNTNGKSFVLSLQCGKMTVGEASADNMMLTLSGTYTGLSSDVHDVTVDEVTQVKGTYITLTTASASQFVTATTNAYQEFTVQRELYDFAVKELKELATYTYEFSLDAANFLFTREFDPFREQLQLGKGIYINMNGLKVVTPLIEMSFDFDDETKLSLVFCNRFKRHDPVNTLKDMIEKSYSTSRSIDASKHLQQLVNDQASSVAQFMNNSLDAAKNRIIAAANQSVMIDGNGIHVGETNSVEQLAIVNNMIALTDDNWEHAKLAIGKFATSENGTYYGINADVIAGRLIVGQNLTIDSGDNMFKVDNSGVYIDANKFVITHGGTGGETIDQLISEKSVATYAQNTPPISNLHNGDLWFNTSTTDGTYKALKWYRYNSTNSSWTMLEDGDIQTNKNIPLNMLEAMADLLGGDEDNVVTTWYQDSDPSTAWTTAAKKKEHVGDLWFNTSSTSSGSFTAQTLYRYTANGSTYSWQKITDTSITKAIVAAQNAQDTADGKINTYYQSTVPSANWSADQKAKNVGDLWFNTSETDVVYNNVTYKAKKSYRWNGSAWEMMEDGGIKESAGLFSVIGTLLDGTEDNEITTWYQNTVPTWTSAQRDSHLGDLWYNTSYTDITSGSVTYKARNLFRYAKSGTSYVWNKITDDNIRKAVEAAQNAQTTADGKINTYRQATDPSASWTADQKTKNVGDIWYNTSSSTINNVGPKKAARWSGNAWQSLEDGSIPTIQTNITTLQNTLAEIYSNGYLGADKLKGTIDTTIALMQSSNGNVLFDSKGIYLLNATTKDAATQAVWLNENGIVFGHGSAGKIEATSGSGHWAWTTAISHSGITADALAGKTVSGMKLYGGELHVGAKGTDPETYNFEVDSSGNLTANSGTFKGTVKGAKFQDANGNTMMNSSYQIKSGYLNLNGINVGNGQFKVDSSGNVTLGANATISWDAIDDAPDIPTLPSYIQSTKITQTTIESPTIKGAEILGAAYYDLNKNAKLNITSASSRWNLYFGQPDTNSIASSSFYIQHDPINGASKMYRAGKDLFSCSFSDSYAFCNSPMFFTKAIMATSKVSFGSLEQRNAISSPYTGQIFFVI